MSKLKLFFILFPLILETIRAVEVAIPIPKTGQAKLDLILGIAEQIYQAEPDLQAQISAKDYAAMITNMTGLIVSVLNAAGVFKTTTPPQTKAAR